MLIFDTVSRDVRHTTPELCRTLIRATPGHGEYHVHPAPMDERCASS